MRDARATVVPEASLLAALAPLALSRPTPKY